MPNSSVLPPTGSPTSLEPGIVAAQYPEMLTGFSVTHVSQDSTQFDPSAFFNEAPFDTARYHFGAELARGGTAAVYHAVDKNLDRDVAIKLLLGEHAKRADIIERFLDEARILGRLPHPGIPPVHDVGLLADGRPFIAMKLVRGRTLFHWLLDAPDNRIDRFLPVFEQICQAIAFAHSQGVIHRDLKPGNIMVGPFGEAQVMDWGLAKDLVRNRGEVAQVAPMKAIPKHGYITQVGSLLGTPAYMPPEQANGNITEVNRRADVFALGAILCEILTGKPPYLGNGAQVTVAALKGDLAGARDRLDQCDAHPELIALAIECLSPDPLDRPADGAAVVSTLASYRQSVNDRLRQAEQERISATARETEHRMRVRTQALLAGAIMVLLVGAGSFAWWSEHQAKLRQTEKDKVAAQQQSMIDQANQAVQVREAAANRAGMVHLDEAEQEFRRGMWANAAAAIGRAETVLHDAQTMVLNERLNEYRRTRDMVRNLDAARNRRRTWVVNQYGTAQAIAMYSEALEAVGIDLRRDTTKISVEKIRANPGTLRIVESLNDWFLLEKTNEGVLLSLKELDPHPARTSIRVAFATLDKNRINQLAREVNPKDLSVDLGHMMSEFIQPESEQLKFLYSLWNEFPTDFFLALHIGNTLSQIPNRRKEALEFTRAAVAAQPTNAAAWNNHGSILSDMGNMDLAIKAFHKAIELDPQHAYAISNLGRSYMKLKQYDDALFNLETAASIDPENSDTLGLIIDCYTLMNRPVGVDHTNYRLSQLIMSPRYANTELNEVYRAGVKMMHTPYPVASEHAFRLIISQNKNHAPAHANLGWVLTRRGYHESSLTHLLRAQEIGLTNDTWKEPMARAMVASKVNVEKERRLNAILNGDHEPTTANEYLEHVETLFNRKAYATVVSMMDRAAIVDPTILQNDTDFRLRQAGFAVNAGLGFASDVTPGEYSTYLTKARLAILKVMQNRPGKENWNADAQQRWAQDVLTRGDFAAIRHPLMLHYLSAEERAEWHALWKRVRELVK